MLLSQALLQLAPLAGRSHVPLRALSTLPSSRLLRVSPEVQDALRSNRPIVALESTIISHGLPYPKNLETAQAVEEVIRQQGAVPATTALFDGHAYVGLDDAQLQRLAEPPKGSHASARPATKTSRRDLAYVLAQGNGSVGGTTVSGTMILAHMAGIDIFATGGIGGVHRGAETSMDISADLTELARTPVAVFCSGAKSILDIPRTLEYLETQGVTVNAFASASSTSSNPFVTNFPAFYTSRSGYSVPLVESPAHAANVIHASRTLVLQNGSVFGVPIPSEYEAAGLKIQKAVEQAVREAVEQGVDKRGKEVTPWLLKRVKELNSESVESNIALVVNNSKVAAQTAKELSAIRAQEQSSGKVYRSAQPCTEDASLPSPQLVVFGAAVVDVTSQPIVGQGVPVKTTREGIVRVTEGGVARNMATAAQRALDAIDPTRYHGATQIVAPLGADPLGILMRTMLKSSGALRSDGLFDAEHGTTPAASLILTPTNDLEFGLIDASYVETSFSPAVLATALASRPSVVAFDSNLSIDAMAALLQGSSSSFIVCEPTSVTKSARIIKALHAQGFLGRSKPVLSAVTPNAIELLEMYRTARDLLPDLSLASDDLKAISAFTSLACFPEEQTHAIAEAAVILARLVGPIFLTAGEHGVIAILPPHQASLSVQHVPSPASNLTVTSTTGAGDTFAGALLALTLHLGPRADFWETVDVSTLLTACQEAAIFSLQSLEAVGDLSRLPSPDSAFSRLVSSSSAVR